MPITREQIEKLLPELVRIANPADHMEVLDASIPTPPQVVELVEAAFELKYDRYNVATLTSLIKAFPAYQFVQAMTIEDLRPLARALKEAYQADVDAHRQTKPHEHLATTQTKS